MAVAFASVVSNSVSATGATGITVNKPASVANGDVLYAIISNTNYATTTAYTCTDWTEVGPTPRGATTGNDRFTCILRKVITNAAGEPASYTFVRSGDTTTRSHAGHIIRVTGADTTTPEDITIPAHGLVSNNSQPASKNADSATADALVISYLLISLAAVAPTTWGPPSGYTDPANSNTSLTANSLNLNSGVAWKMQASPGAIGAEVWTTGDVGTAESLVNVIIVRAFVNTVQATAAGSWGALTGAASATQTTPVQATAAGSWGTLVGSVTATPSAPPSGPPTFVRAYPAGGDTPPFSVFSSSVRPSLGPTVNCSGGSILLICVSIGSQGGDMAGASIAATWDGSGTPVSLTAVNSLTLQGGGASSTGATQMFKLQDPAQASGTLSVTWTGGTLGGNGNHQISACVSVYSGCSGIDATYTVDNPVGLATSDTCSLAIDASNLGVGWWWHGSAISTVTDGTKRGEFVGVEFYSCGSGVGIEGISDGTATIGFSSGSSDTHTGYLLELIGSAQPATVQATATGAWGSLTGTAAAGPPGTVEATASGSWGSLTGSATATSTLHQATATGVWGGMTGLVQIIPPVLYPTTVSGRKWLDQNGDVYLLKCMSSWALAENSASDADITTALEQAAERGFNSVQVALFGVNQQTGWHPYTNHAGDPVFTGTPFQSSLGSAWDTFDWVMEEATRLSLVVVVSLFYGWTGIGCSDDVTSAYNADPNNVYNFGYAVATRYASYPNIVWSLEADREWYYANSPWGVMTDKYFQGIKAGEGDTPRLIIAEPANGITSYSQWPSAFTHTGGFSYFWLDANSVYEYGNAVVEQFDPVYQESGATSYPVWDCEIPYVSNGSPGSANRQQLRERVYGEFFRGVIGMNYGSEDWWPFGYDSWTSGPYTWDTFMDGAEALDAQRAWSLIDTLCADTTWDADSGTFLTTGVGSGDTKAASGFSDTQAAVYFPNSRTIVIDTTVLSGTGNVRLRWYDPTDGTFSTISANEAQQSNRSITYNGGTHADTYTDWVLVVDLVAANQVDATASGSWGGLTATATADVHTPVQATVTGTWGVLTATITAIPTIEAIPVVGAWGVLTAQITAIPTVEATSVIGTWGILVGSVTATQDHPAAIGTWGVLAGNVTAIPRVEVISVSGIWNALVGSVTAIPNVQATPVTGIWGSLVGSANATQDHPIVIGTWGSLTGSINATVIHFVQATISGAWGILTASITAIPTVEANPIVGSWGLLTASITATPLTPVQANASGSWSTIVASATASVLHDTTISVSLISGSGSVLSITSNISGNISAELISKTGVVQGTTEITQSNINGSVISGTGTIYTGTNVATANISPATIDKTGSIQTTSQVASGNISVSLISNTGSVFLPTITFSIQAVATGAWGALSASSTATSTLHQAISNGAWGTLTGSSNATVLTPVQATLNATWGSLTNLVTAIPIVQATPVNGIWGSLTNSINAIPIVQATISGNWGSLTGSATATSAGVDATATPSSILGTAAIQSISITASGAVDVVLINKTGTVQLVDINTGFNPIPAVIAKTGLVLDTNIVASGNTPVALISATGSINSTTEVSIPNISISTISKSASIFNVNITSTAAIDSVVISGSNSINTVSFTISGTVVSSLIDKSGIIINPTFGNDNYILPMTISGSSQILTISIVHSAFVPVQIVNATIMVFDVIIPQSKTIEVNCINGIANIGIPTLDSFIGLIRADLIGIIGTIQPININVLFTGINEHIALNESFEIVGDEKSISRRAIGSYKALTH